MLLGTTGGFRGTHASYQTYDASHIPAAGKVRERGELESTAACIKFEERPPTPDRIKPYRGPNQQEPGRTFKHFGTARDPEPDGVFGVATRPDPEEGVQHALNQGPQDELGRFRQEQAERVYASNKREPLGKAFQRGHVLPDGLGTQVPFGVPVRARELEAEGQVKATMRGSGQEEDPEARELYKRTHGDYEPGEQRTRGYDWGGRDPRGMVFGRPPAPHDGAEVARVLAHAGAGGLAVVPATLADFKATHDDTLGAPRSLGYGDRAATAAPAGLASTRFDELGVEALLKNQAAPEDLAPDADLGRSLRPGWRNVTQPGDEGRRFGVPSVRTDVPAPRTHSLANATNFGNEPDAASLVFPSVGADRGVGDEVLTRAQTLDEIRGVVAAAGVALEEGVLSRAFEMASAGTGKCTWAGFLRAKARVMAEMAGL